MDHIDRILNEKGEVVPEWVAELRAQNNWTQEDLAKEARLTRNAVWKIENQKARRRYANTVRALHTAFRLAVPQGELMEALGETFIGKWNSYHWTRKVDRTAVLQAALWDISRTGACSVKYLPDPELPSDVDAITKKTLQFSGDVYFEGTSRIVFTLRSISARLQEQMQWRFSLNLEQHENIHHGTWSGIDRAFRPVMSSAILSTIKLSSEAAIKAIGVVPDYVARPEKKRISKAK